MAKEILLNEEARNSMKKGIDTTVDLVKTTIGPRGRNVSIESPFGIPTITNDGVSIVKQVSFEDPFEAMGAEIVKEVANRTNEEAGDGTTSTSILLQSIVNEGMKKMDVGLNVVGIKNGMQQATDDIVTLLQEWAQDVTDHESIKQVATISAESEEMGEIIADTIQKIGVDGIVTVQQSHIPGITADIVEGMEVNSGYITPYFVTDTDKMESVIDGAPVFIYDGKLASMEKFKRFMDVFLQSGRTQIVIIAEEVLGSVLNTLVINHLNKAIRVLAIKAPGYGDNQKAYMEDIAAFTGATIVSESKGMKLEETGIEVLGVAERVISKKDSTTFIKGKGDITEYVEALKEVAKTKKGHEKDAIDKRIATITGSVATISVGASTETEMNYLKLKVEDAVNATQAAIDEGIVAGGGSALVHAAHSINRTLQGEEAIGYSIIKKACEAPLKQIGVNAGQGDGSIVVATVQGMAVNSGYDAANDVYLKDMVKAGIIDPVKVTRNAIQNASSAASTFLTTQGAIAELKKDD